MLMTIFPDRPNYTLRDRAIKPIEKGYAHIKFKTYRILLGKNMFDRWLSLAFSHYSSNRSLYSSGMFLIAFNSPEFKFWQLLNVFLWCSFLFFFPDKDN